MKKIKLSNRLVSNIAGVLIIVGCLPALALMLMASYTQLGKIAKEVAPCGHYETVSENLFYSAKAIDKDGWTHTADEMPYQYCHQCGAALKSLNNLTEFVKQQKDYNPRYHTGTGHKSDTGEIIHLTYASDTGFCTFDGNPLEPQVNVVRYIKSVRSPTVLLIPVGIGLVLLYVALISGYTGFCNTVSRKAIDTSEKPKIQ